MGSVGWELIRKVVVLKFSKDIRKAIAAPPIIEGLRY